MQNTTNNKRKAWSVQDTISGKSNEPQSRFKSGYGGPRKSAPELYDDDYAEVGGKGGKIRKSGYTGPRVTTEQPDRDGRIPTRSDKERNRSGRATVTKVSKSQGSGYTPVASAESQRGGYRVPNRSGGLMDYSWAAFAGILVICLIVALTGYGKSIGNVNGYRCPTYMLTMHGVLNDIHEEYVSGGLGSKYRLSNNEPTEEQKAGMLGETGGADGSAPNTTTGATMALDAGTADTSYGSMTSHEELLTALDAALAAGDSAFVGSKLCYENEGGSLMGYPQSVVENFTTYMKDNADKRATFIAEVKSEDHSARNGDAYLVKIPLLKFTINMGTDNTTLSISGFAPLSMNAGQTAVVSPLLPCMYSVDAQTDGKASHSEVLASMSEGNLQISIGSKE